MTKAVNVKKVSMHESLHVLDLFAGSNDANVNCDQDVILNHWSMSVSTQAKRSLICRLRFYLDLVFAWIIALIKRAWSEAWQ